MAVRAWGDLPLVARRGIPALLFTALIVAGLAAHVLRRTPEVYIVLGAVLILLLARSAIAGFWLGLERSGVRDPHGRWREQPQGVQRAVPPLVIAGFVLLIAWAAGVAPDPSLVVLL